MKTKIIILIPLFFLFSHIGFSQTTNKADTSVCGGVGVEISLNALQEMTKIISFSSINISSFTLTINVNGELNEMTSNSDKFTELMLKAFKNVKIGTKFYIENIKGVMKDSGKSVSLSPLFFKVKE